MYVLKYKMQKRKQIGYGNNCCESNMIVDYRLYGSQRKVFVLNCTYYPLSLSITNLGIDRKHMHDLLDFWTKFIRALSSLKVMTASLSLFWLCMNTLYVHFYLQHNLKCLSTNKVFSYFSALNLGFALELIKFWEQKFLNNSEDAQNTRS